jgi:hypothetical protein
MGVGVDAGISVVACIGVVACIAGCRANRRRKTIAIGIDLGLKVRGKEQV